jgi:serine protease Do
MRATLTHLVGPRKGESFSFTGDHITVGRADDNDLSFGDVHRRVSAHHAELVKVADQYILKDRGSTNGTMINGRRIVVSELNDDDLIEFGAGGPLLRYSIQRDQSDVLESGVAARGAEKSGFHSRTTGRLRRDSARSSNAWLIAAMLAAMLVGAIGGVVISRRSVRDPERMTPAEISAANSKSVVFVRTDFELLDSTGQVAAAESRTGSGFIVTSDGLIVTNRHVVHDWEYDSGFAGFEGRVTRITVVLPGHEATDSIEASLYRMSASKEIDVAVLKIDVDSTVAVLLAGQNSTDVVPGSEVVVLGYPLGADLLQQTHDSVFEASLATGTISRVGRDFIQLDLNAYRGNSGGPVLSTRGRVIGILTGRLGHSNIAVCTPISSALPLIK